MSKSVGRNIKKFREEKGLTQDRLAATLNVTRQTLSSWETGRTQPDIDTLHSLSLALEVSVEELIYGEDFGKRRSGPEIHITKGAAKSGITFGAALAMVISYVKWQSVGWAILHGLMSWGYVIYFLIRY